MLFLVVPFVAIVAATWRPLLDLIAAERTTMSGYGLGELLPLAMAVAINPIPVIACILILFSARARLTGPLFLVGWVAGITLVTTAAFILSDATDAADTPATGPSVGDVVLVALGIGLIALAIRQWRSRPGPDDDATLPAWTATLDDLSPLRALGFGLLLAALNFKHVGLAVAAALIIDEGVARGANAGALIALFVTFASLSVAVPVVYFLVGGAGARQRLETWRSWLASHSAALLAAVFAVIGVALIGTGLDGLLIGA